jgi:hypothetical protein
VSMRRALRSVLAEPVDSPTSSILDERASLAAAAVIEDAELLARTRDALRELHLGEPEVVEIARAVRAVERQYRTAQEELVEVGRWLTELTYRAGSTGYKALHTARLVSVDPATASKLRTIYAAVEAHRIPRALLPSRVDVAYFAARQPHDVLIAMCDGGVLTPTVKRPELERFVCGRTGNQLAVLDVKTRTKLKRRLSRLAAIMKRAEEEYRAIQTRLKDI